MRSGPLGIFHAVNTRWSHTTGQGKHYLSHNKPSYLNALAYHVCLAPSTVLHLMLDEKRASLAHARRVVV